MSLVLYISLSSKCCCGLGSKERPRNRILCSFARAKNRVRAKKWKRGRGRKENVQTNSWILKTAHLTFHAWVYTLRFHVVIGCHKLTIKIFALPQWKWTLNTCQNNHVWNKEHTRTAVWWEWRYLDESKCQWPMQSLKLISARLNLVILNQATFLQKSVKSV